MRYSDRFLSEKHEKSALILLLSLSIHFRKIRLYALHDRWLGFYACYFSLVTPPCISILEEFTPVAFSACICKNMIAVWKYFYGKIVFT